MKENIAKALIQAQAMTTPPIDQGAMQGQNPFLLDQALEQQAAPANPPMHPIVAAIMQRLGLMNMIRNRGNASMVAGDQQ